MRGCGGGVSHHILLHYNHHKPLLKDDHDDHKTFFNNFVVTNNIDDEEDQISNGCDDHHNTNNHAVDGDDCNINNDDDQFNLDERRIYWESQEALLQEILEQYSLSGSKLREEISKVIEFSRETKFCECLGRNVDNCSDCLRRRIVNLLCRKGFNASLCTSTWNKSHAIPGGKHEYIDVVVSTQGKRKKIRFLVEIEFRDEFKMPKASDEYSKLTDHLPETYIGKPEHLNAIVRVMCDAAKRFSAERKIHLGPWRKRSFMQMKWSASCETRQMNQTSLKQKDTDGTRSNLPSPATATTTTTTAVRAG